MNKPTPIPITNTNDQYQQPTPKPMTNPQDQSVHLRKLNAPNETNEVADEINYYADAHVRIIFHTADTSQNGDDVHKI